LFLTIKQSSLHSIMSSKQCKNIKGHERKGCFITLCYYKGGREDVDVQKNYVAIVKCTCTCKLCKHKKKEKS